MKPFDAILLNKAIKGGGGVQPSGSINISANGTYDVSAFADAVVDVQSGGDNIMEAYAQGTISKINTGNATTVVQSAFAYYPSSVLFDLNMPNVTSLEKYAFTSTGVKTISAPMLTVIGSYAFSHCTSLETVDLPNVTILSQSAFASCTNLSHVNLPNVVNAGGGPAAGGAFTSCESLKTASMPKIDAARTNLFASCPSFESFVLQIGSYIATGAFYNTALMSLYLLSTSIVTLSNTATRCFGSSPIMIPIGETYGSIFVPASLYSSYLTRANWSDISARIVSMTDEQFAALGLTR